MLKAIIFDYDGVIVDTEIERFRWLKKTLPKYGYKLDNTDISKLNGVITQYFLMKRFPGFDKGLAIRLGNMRRQYVFDNINSYKPIAGVKSLLKSLSKRYAIALTTGSTRNLVERFLKNNDLKKYFKIIMAAEDYKGTKPDPECYIATLKKLGIKPNEAIVIEDSLAGIESAHNAGLRVIGLRRTYNKDQVIKADIIFNNHKDIQGYFRKMD